MSFENRASVGALSGMDSSKWLNGVVQSVSNFGIFVRPAGYEMTGTFVKKKYEKIVKLHNSTHFPFMFSL